jgi:Mg2+ and Co2+ transporter CorA
MASSKELNARITRLTVIMTFLTIVSIVVNVPGTIGAIFGIPALSNAYFESHIQFLIITLISATILSIIFGYIYWKSLKLVHN